MKKRSSSQKSQKRSRYKPPCPLVCLTWLGELKPYGAARNSVTARELDIFRLLTPLSLRISWARIG